MVSFSKSSSIAVAVALLLLTSLTISTSISNYNYNINNNNNNNQKISHHAKVAGNIKCLDAYSCANESLVGDTNVYCVGYYSCENANLSVANVAHCNGDHGCDSTLIEANTQIRCQGNYACSDAEFIDSGDVLYVYGVAGFYKGYIHDGGADSMKCYGFFACHSAQVRNVSNLYVGGLYGFAYAEIDSRDVEDLNVYFTGLHASYGASIYCRNGSNCELTCGANYGCSSNTTMYCYSGSECDYDCDDCATDSCPTVHDENDDSTWKHIYKNVNTFDEFVAINEEIKDKVRDHISNKHKEYSRLGLTGDELFGEWLRNYMRFVNGNDDGTIEMSVELNENNNIDNINSLNKKYSNNRYASAIKAAAGEAAVDGISSSSSSSSSNKNLFDYNIVQIAALSSVVLAVIVGIIYWRCNKNDNIEEFYQKI